MEFGKIFDNLPFKRMEALRKKIQSHVDYALTYCRQIHAILANFDNRY